MRYRTNLDTISLKKLDKNNKFVFNNIVANNKLKSL